MSSSDSSSSFSAAGRQRPLIAAHSSSRGFCRRTLFLLLNGLNGTTSGGTGSGGSTSDSRGSTSGADVQEHVLDVLALKGLGEERSPDRLNVGDTGSLDDGVELVGLFKQHGRQRCDFVASGM
jgi:hypothetical protein